MYIKSVLKLLQSKPQTTFYMSNTFILGGLETSETTRPYEYLRSFSIDDIQNISQAQFFWMCFPIVMQVIASNSVRKSLKNRRQQRYYIYGINFSYPS